MCGHLPAEIVGSNPTRGKDVCSDFCLLSDRVLCDELITRPEESYRLWCVVVCDLETSWIRRPWPIVGCCSKNKQRYDYCCPTVFLIIPAPTEAFTTPLEGPLYFLLIEAPIIMGHVLTTLSTFPTSLNVSPIKSVFSTQSATNFGDINRVTAGT